MALGIILNNRKTNLWYSHISFALDMKEPFLINTSLYFPEARLYPAFKVSTRKKDKQGATNFVLQFVLQMTQSL